MHITSTVGLFKLGDNIGNLICIGKEKRLTLSLREFSYYKDNKLHILRRNQLKPGLLLRCSVKSYDEKQLLLTSPVLFFNDYIRVDKEVLFVNMQIIGRVNNNSVILLGYS